jgi:hypothetical protein
VPRHSHRNHRTQVRPPRRGLPPNLELDKAQILARFAKLRILVGVMICPIIVSLEARIERLHDAFGGNMYIGERQHSRDRQWQWCFACASLDEREGVRSY